MSIDGYIAKEDDSLEWLENSSSRRTTQSGLWLSSIFASVDVLVMGRKTYQKILSFGKWPYEGKRVIVLGNVQAQSLDNVEFYQGDVLPLLHKLYKEGIKHIYIDGGITIAQFLEAQLVDEMIITIIPVLLGKGKPLFHPITMGANCCLLRSEIYSTGLVQLHYAFIKA